MIYSGVLSLVVPRISGLVACPLHMQGPGVPKSIFMPAHSFMEIFSSSTEQVVSLTGYCRKYLQVRHPNRCSLSAPLLLLNG